MLVKRGAGFVVALIVFVTTLWSGAAPTSVTSDMRKGVNSASYEPSGGGWYGSTSRPQERKGARAG